MEVKINQEEAIKGRAYVSLDTDTMKIIEDLIKQGTATDVSDAIRKSAKSMAKEMTGEITAPPDFRIETLVDALILGTKIGFPPPVLSPNQATEAITLIDTIAMAKNLVATIDLRDMIKEAIVKSIESKNFETGRYLIRAIQESQQEILRQESLLKRSKELVG